MGLFSRTKTYIESMSQPLYEDRKPFVQESIYTSILTNGDMVQDLQANYLGSIVMKGKQVRRYAKNNYPLGLPDGTTHYVRAYDDEVRRVLKSILGYNVEITMNTVDTADAEIFSYEHLVTNRGMDIDSLVISNPPFIPPSLGIDDIYFHGAVFLDESHIEITYRGTVRYHGNDGQSNTEYYYETETLLLRTPVVIENPYYHVGYYKVVKDVREGEQLYWFYDALSSEYPTLQLKSSEKESVYYPIIPIRMNKKNMGEDKTTDLYKSSKRLMKFWDIDVGQLIDSVHESPDIKDVDHAYFVVGCDIADDSQTVKRYLFDYFKSLSGEGARDKNEFDYWFNGDKNSVQPYSMITIQDATYRMDIVYSYIHRTYRTAQVCAVGDVERKVAYKTGVVGGSQGSTMAWDASTLTLTKQISENRVEEIVICGLQHTNYVYTRDLVITNLKDAFNKENDKNNFIVPIRHDVCERMSMNDSMDIMYKSMRIVLNSKIKVKLKWYETGFFQVFTKVVGFVLAVYGFYTFAAEMIAATTAIEVATVVLQSIAMTYAVSFSVDFLVNVIGLEAAFVVAVIAMAVGGLTDAKLGSLGSYKLPQAMDLLSLAGAFVDRIGVTTQEMISDTYAEMLEFSEYAEGLMEELEATDRTNQADPYALGYLESPEQYIHRLTFNENIGTLAMEVPSTFHNRLIEDLLPTNDIRTYLS